MNSIYVSFNLKTAPTSINSNDFFDKNYQSVYKPLLKFLYTNPEIPFSFSFSGSQIQFFKKRKNEVLAILKELSDRKQIEVLGGGYYNPILPLIYPADRNGQIDFLSAEIRQSIGKRPRGISLFQDCWDSSLVNNIHTCGIEYVLLESSCLSEYKKSFVPLIMSDLGKTIDILPYYDEFKPNKYTGPNEFVESITKAVEKVEKKENYVQLDIDRIVNINFNHEDIVELLKSKFLDNLCDYLKNNPTSRVQLITPYMYLKLAQLKLPAYVSTGINHNFTKLISTNKRENLSPKNSYTIYDFIDKYPVSQALNNRIMYVSMLVNQYKNDKMRKKAAREKLWEAQNGAGLLCTSNIPYENNILRQNNYKILMEAEKILREDGKFKEAITCFDYNSDGLNEYICRMKDYFSCISLISGAVQELDVVKNNYNYADNLSRKAEYDLFNDDYQRGLFVDHLFTNDQFKKYINNESAGSGIFSRIQYTPIKYSQNHHEIQFGATALIKPTKQRIYLRKKYIINSNGMYVQYIVRNESDKRFCAKLAIESNFAQINYQPNSEKFYNIEVVDNGQLVDIKPDTSTKKFNDKGKLNNIQLVRIADNENGIAFVFEPNEKSGFYFEPLIFNRRGFSSEEISKAGMTYVSTLFWDLQIEPEMETEKSINFTIVPVKKVRK